MTPRPIRKAALSLSTEERLALASDLIESVEGPLDQAWDAAWLAELKRRETEPLVDWSATRAAITAALRGP